MKKSKLFIFIWKKILKEHFSYDFFLIMAYPSVPKVISIFKGNIL